MTKQLIFICIAIIAMRQSKGNEIKSDGAIFTEIEKIRLSYNEWKICYVYELNEYYAEIETFKRCIGKIEYICNNLSENENCKILTNHLAREYEKMQKDVLKVEASKSLKLRRNAPLPIIGKISNVLFGIMDEESAVKYETKLNNLTLSVNEHNDILSEQVTIIKKAIVSTSSTLNKFDDKIHQIALDVMQHISDFNEMVNEETIRGKLNFLSEIAILIILDHKDIQESLSKTLKETATGDISDLVPIDTLKSDFKLVKEKINSNENFPINIDKENIHNIFLFCKVKAGEISDKIFIEISIPIVENKIFTVYDVTPIPILRENYVHMLEIKAKKILANFETSEIIEFNNDDCMGNKNTGRICTTHSAILSGYSESCEASLMFANALEINKYCKTKIIPTANYVIQISKTDEYFIFSQNSITVKQICKENLIEVFEINEPKVIEVDPKGTMYLLNLKLKGHSSQKLQQASEIRPNIDLNKLNFEHMDAKNTPLLSESAIVLDDPADFKEILENLDNLKTKIEHNKKIETIQGKSDSIGYGLFASFALGIFILIIVVYIFAFKIIPAAARIREIANRIPNV